MHQPTCGQPSLRPLHPGGPGSVVKRLLKGRFAGVAWLLPWALAVSAVDPFREVAKDDDWAYALTVQHLLEHHEYRLHDWATANMPAQIFWGAGFASLLGFSFATLRISTLVLLALALLSLWQFLVEEGVAPSDAGILVSVVYSSPLVFLLGMSFMTDVPFMSWLVMALAWYAAALRGNSWRWMLVASLLASAAILTRQFGVALPIALTLLLLAGRNRWPLLAAGVALPAVAGGWQIWSALADPTAFMQINLRAEAQYLADLRASPGQLLWRFTRICQYVGLYALPLGPLLAHLCRRIRPPWPWVAFLALAAVGDFALHGALMPSLNYNLAALASRAPVLRFPLTLASTAAAIVLGGIFFRRLRGWRAASPGGLAAVLVAVGLVVLHLAYVDLIDEYLIPFLPLVVIALAPAFGTAPRSVKRATLVLSLTALAISTAWTFVLLERKTAFWRAAENLCRRGVPAEQIYAGEWTYYRLKHVDDLMRDYSAERIAKSTYLVSDALFAPYRADEAWVMVAQEPYRWFDLTERRVSVYRRRGQPDPPADGDGARTRR